MNPFRDSLELVPRPSPWLIGFVALTHLTATVLVIVVALRLPWNWLLLLPVFASLIGGLHRAR
ncbi:MAG: hypothetical protein L0H83_07265, partial [Salinisphaera sp.]|nr:hypothetical protein [Salinisphaera sp.]